MRKWINRHPTLTMGILALFMGGVLAFNGFAGVQDRSSSIDLMPDPQNYIRLPDVNDRSSNLSDRQGKEAGTDEAWLGNDEGNLVYKGEIQEPIAGKTVVIDSINDLTYFSGDSSGVSFFWIDWGKHYLVDLHAIAQSSATSGYLSGTTGITTMTGVSGIFRSVLQKDDRKMAIIEIAQAPSRVTGYLDMSTGATPVYLFAPVNSACTTYDGATSAATSYLGAAAGADAYVGLGDSGVTHQNMLVTYSTNGSTGTYKFSSATSGGSDWELTHLGEWKAFQAIYNGGVSVVPKRKFVTN